MRVLNPGPGELLDRLTILQLKIEFGSRKGVDVEPFIQERFEVLRALPSPVPPMQQSQVDRLEEMLQKVNRNLWMTVDELEAAPDDMSALGETQLRWLAECGKKTTILNRARSRLVEEINKLFGRNGKEKF